MGRKFKCDSTSSSNCNPCSSSSSSYVYCCTKFPKCKCAPIYYPNNCVPNQYPCNPCAPKLCPPFPCATNPCGPQFPCATNPCGPSFSCAPNPYGPPNSCGTPYTSNSSFIGITTTFIASTPNVNICNPTIGSTITITLPAISTLSGCCYNKMFVISNIGDGTVSISVASGDSLTKLITSLGTGDSVTLYSVYNATGSYWIVI
jgi:hypothetical protein